MSLVSAGFFLLFAALFVVYWAFERATSRKWLLLVASYGLYATFDARFLLLLFGVTGVGFAGGILLDRFDERPRARRAVFVGGIVICLGVLGIFKYLSFFGQGAAALLRTLGFGADHFTLALVLPVGISFYVFKVMAYLIEVRRRSLPATRSALDFFVYVAFFPQLLAGPIDRPGSLLPQLASERTFDYDTAVQGARQVLWGLFKKLALADGLAWSVSRAFGSWRNESAPVLVAGAVLFSFQIYCDFSGYTDISIGIAKLLGIRTMRNFAYPYFSQSIAEFWRRWNISVSSWFRDYVYIPLGGSRVSRARLGFNIMLTFLLSGLWHGANMTFVVWGMLLGVGVAFTAMRRAPVLRMEDTPGGERLTLASAGRMLVTFAFITMSWVFFRSASPAEAVGILARMTQLPGSGAAWLAPLALFPATRKVLLATLVGFVVVEWLQRRRECPLEIPVRSRAVRWIAYTGVVWLTALLAQPMASGRFIYFNF